MKLTITEAQYQKLTEGPKRLGDLPPDTGLYQEQRGPFLMMVLYSPKQDEAFAKIVISTDKSKDYAVTSVVGKHGYGVYMYELAMMYASTEGLGLMPDRSGDISKDAWNVWEFFYHKRPDVKKEPAEESETLKYPKPYVTSEEGQLVFNTIYYLKPNKDLKRLSKKAKDKYKMTAMVKSDELWSV